MTQKQKQFILKKLIPFILREQGRGFAMDTWRERVSPSSLYSGDDVMRQAPSCGTVACIGGSTLILSKRNAHAGDILGLNENQASNLFYEDWPKDFSKRYIKAKTAFRKAQVACALLRKVVRTDGACLDIKS